MRCRQSEWRKTESRGRDQGKGGSTVEQDERGRKFDNTKRKLKNKEK
jgi:hypothetical protein